MKDRNILKLCSKYCHDILRTFKVFVSLYTVMSFLYFFFVTNVYVGIQCTNIGICLNKVSYYTSMNIFRYTVFTRMERNRQAHARIRISKSSQAWIIAR